LRKYLRWTETGQLIGQARAVADPSIIRATLRIPKNSRSEPAEADYVVSETRI
jgi:hypothetical protein